jgi:hypothetical protein
VTGATSSSAGAALADKLAEPGNVGLRKEKFAIRDSNSQAVLPRESLNVLARSVEKRDQL